MKKFILILLLFVTLNIYTQESVAIELSDETTKEIVIPKDREDLENAYLRMAKAYLEETLITKEFSDNNKVVEQIGLDIEHLFENNEKAYEGIIEELKKKDPYAQYVTASYNLLISDHPTKHIVHGFGVDYNGVIYERFIVGTGISVFPEIAGFELKLRIGINF